MSNLPSTGLLFLNLPPLSNAKLDVLSRVHAYPDAQQVDQFVADFRAMGRGERFWDWLTSALFFRTSQRELLTAIAMNKVATWPGGRDFLATEYRQYHDALSPHSELLLRELRPEGRQALLTNPPDIREDWVPVSKLGQAPNGTSIDLVLTQDCFADSQHAEGWWLTREAIKNSGWTKKNDAQEYVVLRQMADKRTDMGNNKGALVRIAHMITGTAEKGGKWLDTEDQVNQTLCEGLENRFLFNTQFAVRR
ncbi:hypothetical protein [Pandoraea sputorum]|uniref:hypothetical protein n=1 Tax=Pandoraea sputorum TaxID=93222 RepID=UPI001242B3E7|nr:hypothetical protein [Pandoraea sputorum]VVE58453.1 hypothetical protein PSP20601_05322 [Pandoraea sputorum]